MVLPFLDDVKFCPQLCFASPATTDLFQGRIVGAYPPTPEHPNPAGPGRFPKLIAPCLSSCAFRLVGCRVPLRQSVLFSPPPFLHLSAGALVVFGFKCFLCISFVQMRMKCSGARLFSACLLARRCLPSLPLVLFLCSPKSSIVIPLSFDWLLYRSFCLRDLFGRFTIAFSPLFPLRLPFFPTRLFFLHDHPEGRQRTLFFFARLSE